MKLPKPSKLKRKEMGKVKRAEAVNPARRIGRNDAIRKRWGDIVAFVIIGIDGCFSDMVAGSRRRKETAQREREKVLSHSGVSADDTGEGLS